MDIEYREVPGKSGYRVGSDGSGWSRYNTRGRLMPEWRRLTLKPLTPGGYLRMYLGGGECRLMHRLVLELFVGPCPEGREACHDNGNRRDNRLSNLRWDTRSANMQDRGRHGTAPQVKGTANPRAKLEAYQVRAIRADHAAGRGSYQFLADRFGVSKGMVAAIVKRRSWQHVA